MCSYWDKNIEPIFSEKLKNMKKCKNLENLRTSEPQKNYWFLQKKKCVTQEINPSDDLSNEIRVQVPTSVSLLKLHFYI